MTDSITFDVPLRADIHANVVAEGQKVRNVNAIICGSAAVFTTGLCAGAVYVAVLSFTAGGGWIVLGVFSCLLAAKSALATFSLIGKAFE